MFGSDFVYREVINIATGEKIGYVSDIEFDSETGSILSIFVPDKNKKFFSSKNKGKKYPGITYAKLETILYW